MLTKKRAPRLTYTMEIGDLPLQSGEILPQVEMALEISGKISEQRDNVVVVCHALTGDQNAVGSEEELGWWSGLIGTQGYVDTENYAVLTINVLGGCYGSTGPGSINPLTGKPYGSQFPRITIRDMVYAQQRVLQKLSIFKVQAVIGGSMGGMIALEWAALFPHVVKKCVLVATGPSLTPFAVAHNMIARQAIHNDPEWKQGDYYPHIGPEKGLAIARMVGLVTYRTEELFQQRFSHPNPANDRDQVESYLNYQGKKLVQRFDANTYLCFLDAMDQYDFTFSRHSLAQAVSHIQGELLIIGIQEDLLFPLRQQLELYELCRRAGKKVDFYAFSSTYGHDAFLADFAQFGTKIESFVNRP